MSDIHARGTRTAYFRLIVGLLNYFIMDEKNKQGIKEFGSWLLLFIEAFLFIITCASCINWGVERKEWLVVVAGAVTLGLGAWRGYKRGRALWDRQ